MDLHVVRVSVPSLEKLVLTKMPILEYCSSLTTSLPLQFLPSQGDQKEWTSNLRRLNVHDCPCLIVSHPLPPSGSHLLKSMLRSLRGSLLMMTSAKSVFKVVILKVWYFFLATKTHKSTSCERIAFLNFIFFFLHF